MKYTLESICLYIVCFVKFVCTFVFFGGINTDIVYLTIVSLPYSFALAYHKSFAWVSIALIVLAVILWICILIFSILGIRKENFRKISLDFIIVASLEDFVLGFFVFDVMTKILSVAISATVLVMALKARNKEQNGREHRGRKTGDGSLS